MKGVILVGGEGTRLRPLTVNRPKPMVPIANEPFLARMIRYLKAHGIDEIILAMGYLPDRIRAYFGEGESLGVRLVYSVEDDAENTPMFWLGVVAVAIVVHAIPIFYFRFPAYERPPEELSVVISLLLWEPGPWWNAWEPTALLWAAQITPPLIALVWMKKISLISNERAHA